MRVGQLDRQATRKDNGPPVDSVDMELIDVSSYMIRRALPYYEGIYVEGGVEGMKATLTVDTGATVTLISSSLYQRLPPCRRPSLTGLTRRVCAAGGGDLACEGVGLFQIDLGSEVVSGTFVVADIQDEVLIGADILQRDPSGPADLLLSEGCMKFRSHKIPLLQVTSRTPIRQSDWKVRMSKDVTIPAHSEMEVEICVDVPPTAPGEFYILEGEREWAEKHSVVMASTIVEMDPSKPIQVTRLLNPHPTVRVVRGGSILGSAEPGLDILREDEAPSDTIRSARVKARTTVPPHLVDLYQDTCKGLSQKQRERVKELLISFSDTFSKGENDLGLTSLIEHTIDTGNARPIKVPPRRVPLAYAGEDKNAIDQMLARGLIQPSKSPWGAALVFVRKKDGSVRTCTDYRGLNSVTVKDAFPLPRTEDCLDAVAGAKVFSTMDITSAYNQVPIRKEDIPKSAFVTKYGLFECSTMCFGMCNAPSTYQRLMEIVLAGLQWQICLIYLDDVIIFSDDFETHVGRIQEVLERMREANLKLKPKKCSLFKSEVKFLGHVLSEEGVLPDPDNVKRLAEWPTPRRVKDVRAFLGLGNYYRRFVQGYSQLVKPLTALTQKAVPFQWTSDCEAAFQTLKNTLLGPKKMVPGHRCM